jgi:PilZ domain-containing protein
MEPHASGLGGGSGPTERPTSGYHRIACVERCEVACGRERRRGLIWNVSVVGVYLVLEPPLPAPGQTVLLSFRLAGDTTEVSCQGRVRWHNPPSIFKGCGRTKMALPPGCGIEFTVLDSDDAARIADRVRATVASAR